MPWRVRGDLADPYRAWLSEIMLQQTTVAAVRPYFAKFLALFPSVADLASAPREAVLAAWAGLGYYSRARNLHAAAQILAGRGFPESEAEWAELPGVGPYTAAALAAIALGLPSNVVDGNVERVIARLHRVERALPQAKPELKALAAQYVRPDRPGDWAQALMDLGATICTPKSPNCPACPLNRDCAALAAGAPELYPRRAPKSERPERRGAAFQLWRGDQLWMVRRPEAGLLAGMAALPSTPWRARSWRKPQVLALAPAPADWRKLGQVRHVFTHFALTLDVWAGEGDPDGDGWWASPRERDALPTVFRKAADLRG